MEILALDLGIKMGYRIGEIHGTENFKTRASESKGMKLLKFRSFLRRTLENTSIDLVVYERPQGRNFTGVKSMSNFEGVLQTFCLDNEIEYKDYTAGQIKRYATGKGNCGKPAMIEACRDILNIEPVDDNHADACWLWELASDDFK